MNLEEAMDALRDESSENDVEDLLVRRLFAQWGLSDRDFARERLGADFHGRFPQDGISYRDGRQDDPSFVLEAKRPTVSISTAMTQALGYLDDPRYRSARYAIATNGKQIALTRKRGHIQDELIPPSPLTRDNVREISTLIHGILAAPAEAVRIAIYNNKGGTGKTTISLYLALNLAVRGRHVLLIDFDHQQSDLSRVLLKGEHARTSMYDVLVGKDASRTLADSTHVYALKNRKGTRTSPGRLEFAPGDRMRAASEMNMEQSVPGGVQRLKALVDQVAANYDYVIIDAPTNWNFFSRSAVIASDYVIVPLQIDGAASVRNAAHTIQTLIPEAQHTRGPGSIFPRPLLVVANEYVDKGKTADWDGLKSELRETADCDLESIRQFFSKKNVRTVTRAARIAKGSFFPYSATKKTLEHFDTIVNALE